MPAGWQRKRLSDLGVWRGGGTPSKSTPEYWVPTGIPWVSPKDMKSVRVVDTEDHISREALAKSAAKIIPPNSVLYVVRSGILRRILPVSILTVEGAVNQDLRAFTPSAQIEPEYVYYYSVGENRRILRDCMKDGTTVESLDVPSLQTIQIPFPPLPEQRRIVAKIEELFTQVDAGVQALERAKVLLKQYRQSLLKSAFSGKVTEKWRQENRDKIEPASLLLERIREERKKKMGKRYKELPTLDTSSLPELPEGWAWARFTDIFDCRLGKMLDQAKNLGTLHPYLGNINVRWHSFDLIELKEIRLQSEEIENVSAVSGDLIICEGGEPGRCAVWEKSHTIVIQKALHRARPLAGIISHLYAWQLELDSSTHRLARLFTGTTIKHLPGEKLFEYLVRVPPKEEQAFLCDTLDTHMADVEGLGGLVAKVDASAEPLRQSILTRAFKGKLVPASESERKHG
ncbi:MAG: restriction endonuclease subunit S [Spirochaetia bacterium]|nr:restriction endonuclease subunit S [Spirochaetia bacterium]